MTDKTSLRLIRRIGGFGGGIWKLKMSNLDSPYRWDRDTGVFRKLLREAEIAARSRPGGIPEVLGTFLEYSEKDLTLFIFSLFIDSYPPPPGTQDLDPSPC